MSQVLKILFLFFCIKGLERNLEQVVPDELLDKADFPRLVITCVSIIGVILLFINVVLVACYMFRKRVKRIKGRVLFVVKIDFGREKVFFLIIKLLSILFELIKVRVERFYYN